MTNKKVNYKDEYQKLVSLIVDSADDIGVNTLKKVQDSYNEVSQKSQSEKTGANQEKKKESWEAFL